MPMQIVLPSNTFLRETRIHLGKEIREREKMRMLREFAKACNKNSYKDSEGSAVTYLRPPPTQKQKK